MRNHQTSSMPSTLEGKVVRFSDKIAYTYHDMDDAVRAGILKERDIPREIGELIGGSPLNPNSTKNLGSASVCLI